MKVKIRNLGAIGEGTIDLSKKINLLCGYNGTGKTYFSYIIYGLLRNRLHIRANDELADKLEMSERTIYRYIDTFKAAGFAVEKLYGNIYRLTSLNDDTLDLSKLVYFSEEEAAIVNNMIDGLDNTNALKIGLKRKLGAFLFCS